MGVKSTLRRLFQGHGNCSQYTFQIPKHIAIPEPENPESSGCQPPRAFAVVVCLFLVLPAVKLDYQLSIQADEIDEVHANRKLAAKLIAQQLTASQQAPQDNLGFRGIFSQATSP